MKYSLESTPMTEEKRSLWSQFVTIAQPYFFPTIRGGSWAMLPLMLMLLLFLFGVLFMMVAGLTITTSVSAIAAAFWIFTTVSWSCWDRRSVDSFPYRSIRQLQVQRIKVKGGSGQMSHDNR